MVVEVTAKDTELKYYENLSKSMQQNGDPRQARWAESEELAKKRQQQREALERREQEEATKAAEVHESIVAKTDRYRSGSRGYESESKFKSESLSGSATTQQLLD